MPMPCRLLVSEMCYLDPSCNPYVLSWVESRTLEGFGSYTCIEIHTCTEVTSLRPMPIIIGGLEMRDDALVRKRINFCEI